MRFGFCEPRYRFGTTVFCARLRCPLMPKVTFAWEALPPFGYRPHSSPSVRACRPTLPNHGTPAPRPERFPRTATNAAQRCAPGIRAPPAPIARGSFSCLAPYHIHPPTSAPPRPGAWSGQHRLYFPAAIRVNELARGRLYRRKDSKILWIVGRAHHIRLTSR